MKLNKLLQKSFSMLVALLILGGIAIPANNAYCQPAADLPTLSLTGLDNSFNSNWYPDGRLTVAASKSKDNPSTILVPVFIRYKEKQDDFTHSTKRIYSFDMKVKYDHKVFKPIRIIAEHPLLDDPKFPNPDLGRHTVGKQFQFDFSTYNDTNFLQWLDIRGEQNKNGSVMKIIGTSAQPLPSTLDARGNEVFRPFFYIVMQVLPTLSEEDSRLLNKITWFVIDADSIYFNKIRTVAGPNYPNVAGINIEKTNELWANEPYRKGTLMAKVMNKMPAFDFFMQKLPGVNYAGTEAIRAISKDDLGNGKEFEFVDPITVDWKRSKDEKIYGERSIQIKNSVIGTRMSEVIIESDQPWLEVATSNVDNDNFKINYTDKYGYFPYLDNGILGSIYYPTDKNNITPAQQQILLNIRCNPDKITLPTSEPEGKYVGYLTFRSRDAVQNPVRLKVTFILLRNAYEPDLYLSELPVGATARHTGIRLTLKQAYNNASKTLVFGTAPRATAGIDTLMGERRYLTPLDNVGFDARFYSLDSAINADVPNGFMDALPDINRPDYVSRDIRDINDTLQSLTYYVKFHTQQYPIYINWNVNDFPAGAILYLKDLQTRGGRINVNMREGTVAGTDGTMSYTFTDASLNDFIIEYTLPKVFEYKDDADGIASIQKGWNLLSLPVRPTNAAIKNVYPNSINNNVLTFFPSGWEQESGNLKPGVGFFILYNNIIDKKFAGLQIKGIGPEFGDKVRIIKGWNLIGSISAPVSVLNVSFAQVSPSYTTPDLEFVRFYGFWAYRPSKGYYQVNMLSPGFGYFMKAGKGTGEQEDVEQSKMIESYLRITPGVSVPKGNVYANMKEDILSASSKLNISDNNQSSTTVYLSNDRNAPVKGFEMPPVLGPKYFDVRFAENTYLSNSEKATIQLSGVKYPVSIAAMDNNSDLFFYDAQSNELLGVITKNSGKNIEINKTTGNTINVVKENTDLRVYPNPASTNAQVSYFVPENGFVTVKIINSLGNEVATVFQGDAKQGIDNKPFNVNTLPTGTYFVKVIGNSFSNVSSFTVVK